MVWGRWLRSSIIDASREGKRARILRSSRSADPDSNDGSAYAGDSAGGLWGEGRGWDGRERKRRVSCRRLSRVGGE